MSSFASLLAQSLAQSNLPSNVGAGDAAMASTVSSNINAAKNRALQERQLEQNEQKLGQGQIAQQVAMTPRAIGSALNAIRNSDSLETVGHALGSLKKLQDSGLVSPDFEVPDPQAVLENPTILDDLERAGEAFAGLQAPVTPEANPIGTDEHFERAALQAGVTDFNQLASDPKLLRRVNTLANTFRRKAQEFELKKIKERGPLASVSVGGATVNTGNQALSKSNFNEQQDQAIFADNLATDISNLRTKFNPDNFGAIGTAKIFGREALNTTGADKLFGAGFAEKNAQELANFQDFMTEGGFILLDVQSLIKGTPSDRDERRIVNTLKGLDSGLASPAMVAQALKSAERVAARKARRAATVTTEGVDTSRIKGGRNPSRPSDIGLKLPPPPSKDPGVDPASVGGGVGNVQLPTAGDVQQRLDPRRAAQSRAQGVTAPIADDPGRAARIRALVRNGQVTMSAEKFQELFGEPL